MPPRPNTTPSPSEIGSAIYNSAPPTAIPTAAISSDDDHTDRSWGNYLYVVIVIALVFIFLGFIYQRKRRGLRASPFPRRRFQPFQTHHPSQSRDISAVQANHRVWRNIREGPFSHHARENSTGSRRAYAPIGVTPRRIDPDEEVPPPYVLAEPERTLQRGPSARGARETWLNRRTGDDVGLRDFGQTREPGSVSKPPGYVEHQSESRG